MGKPAGVLYTAFVHRTQVYLDDGQYQALRSRAQREKKTLAAVLREILDQHLGGARRSRKADALDRVIGIGEGDGQAVAEHYQDHLYGARR